MLNGSFRAVPCPMRFAPLLALLATVVVAVVRADRLAESICNTDALGTRSAVFLEASSVLGQSDTSLVTAGDIRVWYMSFVELRDRYAAFQRGDSGARAPTAAEASAVEDLLQQRALNRRVGHVRGHFLLEAACRSDAVALPGGRLPQEPHEAAEAARGDAPAPARPHVARVRVRCPLHLHLIAGSTSIDRTDVEVGVAISAGGRASQEEALVEVPWRPDSAALCLVEPEDAPAARNALLHAALDDQSGHGTAGAHPDVDPGTGHALWVVVDVDAGAIVRSAPLAPVDAAEDSMSVSVALQLLPLLRRASALAAAGRPWDATPGRAGAVDAAAVSSPVVFADSSPLHALPHASELAALAGAVRANLTGLAQAAAAASEAGAEGPLAVTAPLAGASDTPSAEWLRAGRVGFSPQARLLTSLYRRLHRGLLDSAEAASAPHPQRRAGLLEEWVLHRRARVHRMGTAVVSPADVATAASTWEGQAGATDESQLPFPLSRPSVGVHQTVTVDWLRALRQVGVEALAREVGQQLGEPFQKQALARGGPEHLTGPRVTAPSLLRVDTALTRHCTCPDLGEAAGVGERVRGAGSFVSQDPEVAAIAATAGVEWDLARPTAVQNAPAGTPLLPAGTIAATSLLRARLLLPERLSAMGRLRNAVSQTVRTRDPSGPKGPLPNWSRVPWIAPTHCSAICTVLRDTASGAVPAFLPSSGVTL